MGYQLKDTVYLSDIAKKTNLEFKGLDVLVKGVAPFTNCSERELSFSKNLTGFKSNTALVVQAETDTEQSDTVGYLLSDNPRLDFIRVLSYLESTIGFSTYDFCSDIHPSVKIGKNVVIEDGCKISEGVVIEHNVVIHAGTQIGKNSRIRSCASIGGDGFGFERLKDGTPIRFVHLGGVIIGENVEIGTLNSVARGTLSDTVICDYVKTDNLVHIAHNCIIGKNTLITASAQFSGGVIVGECAWIGPNSSILQKINIGDNALVGLGAVVTKNVSVGDTVAGNPARSLLRRK